MKFCYVYRISASLAAFKGVAPLQGKKWVTLEQVKRTGPKYLLMDV